MYVYGICIHMNYKMNDKRAPENWGQSQKLKKIYTNIYIFYQFTYSL